jgi:hypothetical protein
MNQGLRGVMLGLALLGGAALGPAPAAADGGDTSLVHACAGPPARNTGGYLRRIEADASCRPGETPVHWLGAVGDPPPPPPPIPKVVVVRDANGAQVGTVYAGSGIAFNALVEADGKTFTVTANSDRLRGVINTLYFTAHDCAGTAFLDLNPVATAVADAVPPIRLSFIPHPDDDVSPGPTVWTNTPGETPASRSPLSRLLIDPAGCGNDNGGFPSNVLSVVMTPTTLGFVAPFRVAAE